MDEQTQFWLALTHSRGIDLLRSRLGVRRPIPESPDITSLETLVQNHGAYIVNLMRLDMDPDLRWLAVSERRRFIPLTHADYPSRLREIPDPPAGLFVDGTGALQQPAIAIVGSRQATPQGRETATRMAQGLCNHGFCVVSGLAVGVDACAHQGALAGGSTIGVCATGLDTVYPKSHAQLARRIAAKGALVSEFPIGVGPRKSRFPQRNRIISGLSLGVVVVEAGLQSGSLITARLGVEQNREIFAVPGSVRSPLSKGCHKLLKEGAKLVETVQDIVEEFSHLKPKVVKSQSVGTICTTSLPDSSVRLLDTMGFEASYKDELIARSGLTASDVSSMLLQLELEGLVELCADGTYLRK